ncbi:PPE family protein [[Mycobacterium] vasticus]
MLWMASPPEVHSALLGAGPGPGPLFAAAAAWSALSAEYATVAEELAALVTLVSAGFWQGAAGEQYQAAHQPYLAWLNQAGADSARMAAAQEEAAAAYVTALATMPTLAELAANHATHGVLVATNFFGINTIPIALNEADYFRMWVQAATTMATYQGVCEVCAAATPAVAATVPIQKSAAASSQSPSSGNPLQGLLEFLDPILKSLGIQDGVTAHDPMISNALTTAVSHFLQNLGINWNPAAGTLNGQVYDYYSNAAQPIWYLARSLELFEDFLNIAQNPSQIIPALQYIAALALFDWPTHIAQLATTISQSPALIAAAAGAVVAPAGGLGGLAGLAGLTGPLPGAVAAAPVGPLTPPVLADVPALAVGSAVATAPPPPAPPPAAVPAGAAPGPPAPAPPPAVSAGLPVFPYLVGGGPGIDFGSGLGAHAAAADSAKKKSPTPEAASAAAAAAARRAKRLRRRKTRLGHGDAAMDLRVRVSPDWEEPTSVSERGAGELGRSDAAPASRGRAAGLTRLAGTFDGVARLPLLPESWGGMDSGGNP